jgi:hypothetical protein
MYQYTVYQEIPGGMWWADISDPDGVRVHSTCEFTKWGAKRGAEKWIRFQLKNARETYTYPPRRRK